MLRVHEPMDAFGIKLMGSMPIEFAAFLKGALAQLNRSKAANMVPQ